MAAWGFSYKSSAVWVKSRTGTGYWFRNRHEYLLIGIRGNVPAPVPGDQPESVITAANPEHSRKPEIVAEMIATLYPLTPKLEMFARQARPGWGVHSNESG